MKLILPQRNPPLTETQKQLLIQLRAEGVHPEAIASCELLGHSNRSTNSIRKHCGKLGLAHKNRSCAAKKRKIWQPGEKKCFDNYLKRNSATLSSDELAKEFDVTRMTVDIRQKKLGVKPSLAETLTLPFVKKKIETACRQRSKMMLKAFEAHIAKKEKELTRLAQKMLGEKQDEPLIMKFCPKCERWWPKQQKFFFHSTYKVAPSNGTRTSWHFNAPCKLCVGKEQHRKNVRKHKEKYDI